MQLPRFRQIHRQYYKSPARIKLVPAGRRSYKTEIAKRIANEALYTYANQGNQYFLASPTLSQTKSIYWADMKKFIPDIWRDSEYIDIRESDLQITMRWNPKDENTWSFVKLLSMDKPERIEGSMWHGGVIDEIPDCKPNAWDKHVYPALMDSGGWAILLGTPEGNKFYQEHLKLCKYIYTQTEPGKMKVTTQIDGDVEWAGYKWWTSLVRTPDEVAKMAATMDDRTYRQELQAEMQSYEGLLYYTFNSDINVKDNIAKWNRDEPIYLSCDFNKAPMVWEVAQIFHPNNIKSIKFIDEISIPSHAKTEIAARRFIEKFRTHKHKRLYLTGDASGKVEGHIDYTTDYLIIEEALSSAGWNVIEQVPSRNANVNNRVNVVCSLLCSRTNIVRLWFNSNCIYAIEDMKADESNNQGGKDKKTNPDRTHGSDGVDYLTFQEFSKEFEL